MERRLIRETSFDLTGKLFRVSWLYVLLLCALAGVGYAALYSAAGGSPDPYARQHIIRFAFGLVLMLGIALVDIRFLARLAWPSYLFSLGLLVLVARMGHVGKGAQRWIDLGGVQLQPSEMMKITLVLALAAWFHRASWERMGNPLFLIPPIIAVLLPVGLILKEPNLGTAVITALVGAAVFFAAGVRWWKFLLVALPVPFAAQAICTTTRRPASIPSSIPKAIRWAPATTSSNRRSRWVPAACGARDSCKARRAI
jgi:rod shape determining protein RodA